jgi:hypothetical protein
MIFKICNNLRTLSLFLFFLSYYSFIAISQESIDLSFDYGSVLVHSPKIEPISMNPVRGFSLSYSFKNSAGENWRRYYNYPNYGVTYMYKTYNNPDVLGDSHSITSFLQLSFLPKRRCFDIGFKGLAGFGYFTKQYDPVLNPTNQAISAKFNITAETRLYAKVRVKPVYFEYSFGLNHSSNGLVKSPNLGINVVNNKFTVGIEFEDKIEKTIFVKKINPRL